MVAWRSLGKGEDMDKLVLYTAVWLITKPKEMEEQEVVAGDGGTWVWRLALPNDNIL